MKNDLNSLLAKEMDRREFLKHIGIGVVALTGASALLKTLNSISGPTRRTSGFGSGAYGGNSSAR